MAKIIEVISLGAGVQSSVMSLLAAKGELTPMPIAAVFSDTLAEPPDVYEWLGWLRKQLPFPVYVVKANGPSLEDSSTLVKISKKTGNKYIRTAIPGFTAKGGKGKLQRHCTRDFKITPVHRKIKQLLKEHGAEKCNQWIGISTDEAHREKPSREPKIINRHPLLDIGMSRTDCISWFKENYSNAPYPEPPRSSCIFCPLHSDEEWLRLKTNFPDAFQRAVNFEKKLCTAMEKSMYNADAAYLHVDRKPLDQIEFVSGRQGGLFGEDCEGFCGV